MKTGYKNRCYPNAEQKVQLERDFGAGRFVWNFILNESKDRNWNFKILGLALNAVQFINAMIMHHGRNKKIIPRGAGKSTFME